MKTSVEDWLRSSSAARRRAPFTSARLPSPAESATAIWTCVCPRTPSSRMRAACSPKRISSASERVRGENPCVPTCSDSSRFVLPAPFAPDRENQPGLERQLQTGVRAEVREEDRGDDQPARRIGMIRYQKSSSGALEQSGPQRVDQPKAELVALGGLDSVAHEVRVEADLERLALEANRERLAGLADVLCLRPDGQLALGEAQPQRRVAMRHHRRCGGRPRATPRAGASTSCVNSFGRSSSNFGNWPSMRRVVSHVPSTPNSTWFSWTPSSSVPPADARRRTSSSARAGTIASMSGTCPRPESPCTTAGRSRSRP